MKRIETVGHRNKKVENELKEDQETFPLLSTKDADVKNCVLCISSAGWCNQLSPDVELNLKFESIYLFH